MASDAVDTAAFPKREVYLYFHGHNSYVKVNDTGVSLLSDWVIAHRRGQAAATVAAGVKYKLGTLSNAKHQPLVLAPENGIPVPTYVVGEKVVGALTSVAAPESAKP